MVRVRVGGDYQVDLVCTEVLVEMLDEVIPWVDEQLKLGNI